MAGVDEEEEENDDDDDDDNEDDMMMMTLVGRYIMTMEVEKEESRDERREYLEVNGFGFWT